MFYLPSVLTINYYLFKVQMFNSDIMLDSLIKHNT